MTEIRLTGKQKDVLWVLNERDENLDGCPTGPEIAGKLRWAGKSPWAEMRGFYFAGNGQKVCKQLEAKGLVEMAGKVASNAATWRITDAGRKMAAHL